MSRTLLVAVGCCLAIAPLACTPARPTARPRVVLTITSVTTKVNGGEVLFVCDTTLENTTDSDLIVKSNYYSAFDGLILEVYDAQDRKLARQEYTFHQSIHSANGREFRLRPGRNSRALRFPVTGLPADAKAMQVHLVGTLPGCESIGTLTSNRVDVTIK